MSHRLPQVNELIRQELGKLLLTEVEFPRGCLVTITGVETSKDLRYAKVWLSVLPHLYTEKILNKLTKRAGYFQFLLNKKLTMRPLPHLTFKIDDLEQKAGEIEQLLDRIKETG